MDYEMTDVEFHEAWNNLSLNNYVPVGYWDKINEQRKQHRFVGKKARIDGKIYECTKAEDDLIFFKITANSELIISGDNVMNIKWI